LKIYNNISLRKYNTFGIDIIADKFITVECEEDAILLLKSHKSLKGQLLILGAGSNFLFAGDFCGTVLHSQIRGIRVEDTNDKTVMISAGSGITWDQLVDWCVEKDYGGLENLSLIPGTVGASPVQNIGAYGVEAGDSIEKVRAVSVEDGSVREFSNTDCRFGYRDSVFKNELKGKFFVTAVFFRLYLNPSLKTGYGALAEEVEKKGGATLRNVRQAVIDIRRSKLPDPADTGNAGSFFKNPVVSVETASALKIEYPDMPVFPDSSGGVKLAAGWLIECCGWKGFRKGDAGVHEKQALVIVNYGNASGSDIYSLSEDIKESVFNKFELVLEREVEILGAI
jgi:UDP-N-acetylmuramate dehydrogenase